MKNIISSMICASAAVFLLASCEDETVTKITDAPSLSFSPSTITVSAGAVSPCTIYYSVNNPVNGATIDVTSDVLWLTDFDLSVSGQARFSIEANTGNDMRLASVKFTYNYDGDFVSANVAVIQYGYGDASLSVKPNVVTAAAEGGVYSFGYSIDNPIDGEELKCEADVNWITDFDYSTNGVVAFTLDRYEGDNLRSGVITVAYAGLTKEVSVVQDHIGAVESIIGTYTAHGTVHGNGVTGEEEMDWTVKIYDYTGSNNLYDYYFDGVVPCRELYYETYGDFSVAAGAFLADDGTLHIPSQVTGAIINSGGTDYYLGYTPCSGKSSSGAYTYLTSFPDLVFTYNSSTGKWESDYGVFMAGCTQETITSFYGNFQVVLPIITLTKTADTTSYEKNY